MITRFTMTGADDGTAPFELLSLSKKYPFVEWGILITNKALANHAKPRFPSIQWIENLYSTYNDINHTEPRDPIFRLSGHICGNWVTEIFRGEISDFVVKMEKVLPMFKRFQLNTHGEAHGFDREMIYALNMLSPAEIIFQFDNQNTEALMETVDSKLLKCSALFDLSHGAGILPEEWPETIKGVKCGYAGGLNPENLVEQIGRILDRANGNDVWIDMETHVRSTDKNGISYFDLEKVEQCLIIAEPFIKK